LKSQVRTSRSREGARVPAGYIHLPQGSEAEWVKQLVAEQMAEYDKPGLSA
jgi:hypothetical protein